MFKTILVGYDGPGRGDEAAALAEVLSDPRAGTLLLTSVVAPGDIEELDDETTEVLEQPGRVQVRAVVSHSPGRALRDVAEAEHADLVVVGSSRRSALGRPLPGTAAERLLDDPPCPIAVAPRGYSGGDIRRIGVAYDGSPAADTALRVAESLALELGAPLTVYRVVGSPSPSAGMIGAGDAQVLNGVSAEEIPGRAYGVVDLLFVGACDHGPLRRALLGNISGALVRAAGCPVVVTPRSGVAPRHPPNGTLATAATSLAAP